MSLSEALPTTAIDTVSGVYMHAEALQATVSEELTQGPYMSARAGFELTESRKVSSLPIRHHAPHIQVPYWL